LAGSWLSGGKICDSGSRGGDPRSGAEPGQGGDDPAFVHQALAVALEACVNRIAEIHHRARADGDESRPAWPMIILRTPKGWTCPPVVDGQQVEGTFRAHQVPLPAARANDEHRRVLEEWLRSYRPDELFDTAGRYLNCSRWHPQALAG